jgi:predicted DNA-binding transcriptional regulator AlpA
MTTPLSREELLALPPVVNVETAARALGCGRTLAYDLARRGEFPCRVLRLGSRWVVPTADLLRVIGLANEPPTNDRPAA